MKRLIVLLFAVCMFSQGSLWAQDAPKAEIFGGFSVLRVSAGGIGTTAYGWQGSIAGTVSDRVSLVGDFGGQYKNEIHRYQYMGGIQGSKRTDTIRYFGHALYGAQTTGGGSTANVTSFLMAYGVGVDVKAGDKVAVRAIQADWLPARVGGSWLESQFRFGFGLVFLAE
jgi:hypothetical protein